MGPGVHQGKEYRREDQKNVTQAKQATGNRISRKHGGGVGSAPTRPTIGASGQRADRQSLLKRGKLSFRFVTKRKDA